MPDNNKHPITRALLLAIKHSREPMMLTQPRLPDNPVIAVSPAFMAMTGYSETAIVGRNCRILQGELSDPEMRRHIRLCVKQQQGCIEWVLNYRRDGSIFWNLLFILPVFESDGRLLHFFGNQREVTKRLPAGLPDFRLGPANISMKGEAQLYTLLREMTDEPRRGGQGDAAAAHALERMVGRVRLLNKVTTHLMPAKCPNVAAPRRHRCRARLDGAR